MLTGASRALLIQDRLSGRLGALLRSFPFEAERFTLRSGSRELAAIYVSAKEDAPAFLICHGIGERVEYWAKVQRLLQQMGVSSLVFNYTGFGASPGRVRTAHCEEDALAAFEELRARGVKRPFLVGYSLGAGVASAVAARVEIEGVILCQGFTSLREAVLAVGVPDWLSLFAGDVWCTAECVKKIDVPVLVVHSDADGLFPVAMAKKIARSCGARGEEIVVKGLSHNQAVFDAPERYWRPIVEWAERQGTSAL